MPSLFSLKDSKIRGTPVKEIIQTLMGTGASNVITFSNIPQIYRDLEVVITSVGTGVLGFHQMILRINGSILATDYYWQRVYGIGPTPGAAENVGTATFILVGNTPGTGANPATAQILISDYTSNAKYKTVQSTSISFGSLASSGQGAERYSGVYVQTTPVTEILLGIASGGNLATTTRATLYGIPG